MTNTPHPIGLDFEPICARDMAKIANTATKQRVRQTIKTAIADIHRLAEAGSTSVYIGSGRPEIRDFFSQRGFSVTAICNGTETCVSWDQPALLESEPSKAGAQ